MNGENSPSTSVTIRTPPRAERVLTLNTELEGVSAQELRELACLGDKHESLKFVGEAEACEVWIRPHWGAWLAVRRACPVIAEVMNHASYHNYSWLRFGSATQLVFFNCATTVHHW